MEGGVVVIAWRWRIDAAGDLKLRWPVGPSCVGAHKRARKPSVVIVCLNWWTVGAVPDSPESSIF